MVAFGDFHTDVNDEYRVVNDINASIVVCFCGSHNRTGTREGNRNWRVTIKSYKISVIRLLKL